MNFLNSLTLEKIFLGLVIVLIFYVILAYNGFVKRKFRVKEAWSDIEVQLKRRHDLIDNLVEIVKGYMKHESETLTKVIEARNSAIRAKNIKELGEKENILNSTLKELFLLVENYPNLKANENFLHLQQELTDTENKIQAARRFYNQMVLDYNTFLNIFPNNILNLIFRFKEEEFFDLESSTEAQKPEIKF